MYWLYIARYAEYKAKADSLGATVDEHHSQGSPHHNATPFSHPSLRVISLKCVPEGPLCNTCIRYLSYGELVVCT